MELKRLASGVVRHSFTMAMGVGAVATLTLGLALIWHGEGPKVELSMLPKPAKVTRVVKAVKRKRRKDQAAKRFLEALVADAKRFGAPIDKKRFFAPFPLYRTVLDQKLSARRGRIETQELRLLARTKTMEAPLGGGGFYKAAHILMSIENRTDDYLAFRVVTVPSGRIDCRGKARLPQTTLVLAPRAAFVRVECLAKGGNDFLTVKRIEAMTIPLISYHYLLKVRPVSVGLPARTSSGHHAPNHRTCVSIPRGVIEQSIRSGKADWVDVIDFYARYSCDRHDFRPGYRRQGRVTKRPLLKLVRR